MGTATREWAGTETVTRRQAEEDRLTRGQAGVGTATRGWAGAGTVPRRQAEVDSHQGRAGRMRKGTALLGSSKLHFRHQT